MNYIFIANCLFVLTFSLLLLYNFIEIQNIKKKQDKEYKHLLSNLKSIAEFLTEEKIDNILQFKKQKND
jgi:hypothetical protein